MLAPLLDKMTTSEIENRFTAAEALHFFEEMLPELTEDQLNLEEYLNPEGYISYEYDRWRDLPEDFQRKWAPYRQSPTPLMTKVLRATHSSKYIPYYFIPSVRYFLFKLRNLPGSIWAHFVGLIGFH